MAKKKKEADPGAALAAEKELKRETRAKEARESFVAERAKALDDMKSFAATVMGNALRPLDDLAAKERIKDGGQVAAFKEKMVLQIEEFIEAVAVLPEA